MVRFQDCTTAQPGEGGNEEPPGGLPPGVTFVDQPDITSQPDEPRDKIPPPGNGGGGPPLPGEPFIDLPDRMFIPVDDPPLSTVIVVKCEPIPISTADTVIVFYDPTNPLEGGITEVSMPITGDLLNLPDCPEGFSARIYGLDNPTIDSEDNFVYNPTIEVTIPTSPEALSFYAANTGLLDSLLIGSPNSPLFEVVWLVNFLFDDTGEYNEWYRTQEYISVPATIVDVDVPEAEEPDITYKGDLIVQYNTPVEKEVIHTLTPETWFLGDYEITDTPTLTPPPAYEDDAGYTDDNFNIQPGGTLEARSTIIDLEGIGPSSPLLALRIPIAPKPGFSGEDDLIQIGIPLDLVEFVGGSPGYDEGEAVTITINDSSLESIYTLQPTDWPVGSVVNHIWVRDSVGNPPTYDDGDETYGWTEFSFNGVESDNSTGNIIFRPLENSFDPGLSPVAVDIEVADSDGQTYSYSLTVLLSDGPGTGGSPENFTTVINGLTGTKIKIPKGLSRQPVTSSRRTFGSLEAPGKRAHHRSVSVPISPQAEAKKRQTTTYSNGITNPNYTFYRASKQINFLGLPFVKKSIFGTVVDETVKGILDVNAGSKDSDYLYSAFTHKKLKNSLSDNIKTSLEGKLSLDGAPLENDFISSMAQGLIRNEIYFSEEDFVALSQEDLSTTSIEKTNKLGVDNYNALNLILQNCVSINPNDYGVVLKNKLINWKPLSEDLNKNIIFSTSEGVDTPVYIPNSDKITVFDSTGTSHTLEMQNGDFFLADTVGGDDRLTVYSDIKKAKVLGPEVISQAAVLAGEDFHMSLDCSSDTSDLVEYNVDTTSARAEYYFLKLNKDTIEDLPNMPSDGDTLFSRKTKAVYDYTTTGIDDYVKNNAFPNVVVYLRHDDMLFNHLEKTKTGTLTWKDLTLNNFSNTPDNLILIRQLPQHILIIPSDRTENVFSHKRSKLVDFNTRRATLKVSPFTRKNKNQEFKPVYLKTEYTSTDSINFDLDIENNIIYQEKVKYVFDTAAVNAIKKYTEGTESLPRKVLPTGEALAEINKIKTVYSLTNRDSITIYDLYSRLKPSIYRSFGFDQEGAYSFRARLAQNLITEDKTVNETYFVPVKEVSNISNAPPVLLPDNTDAPKVSAKRAPASTPTPSPGGPPDPGGFNPSL